MSRERNGGIAHLSFSGDFGGREKVAVSLHRSMIAQGKSVFLYVVVEERAGSKRNRALLDALGDVCDSWHIYRTGSRFSFRLMLEVAARLRKDRVTLAHCHCYKSLSYCLTMRLLGLFQGVVTYTLHGLLLDEGLASLIIRCSERLGLRVADGVIGCSREVLERTLTKHWKKPAAVIANAIERSSNDFDSLMARKEKSKDKLTSSLGLDRSLPLAINVGRLCASKDFPLYLRLIRRIADSKSLASRTQFLIVGEGEQRKMLEAEATRLAVQNRVTFTGFVSEMDVIYESADLLIQTSIREGTPMCVLEARSFGLPVVVPAIGGNVDVVTGNDDGVLYPVGDLDALTAGVEQYLNDPALRIKHGRRAFEHVAREFGTRSWVLRHFQFYDELFQIIK